VSGVGTVIKCSALEIKKKAKTDLGLVAQPIIPALGRLRQKDVEFEAI
jgi:single-stranded DNA-specific DHH superfamily exonuclease